MLYPFKTENLNSEILTMNLVTFKRLDGGSMMKNVNIIGVYWKIQFLGEGAWKTNI